MIRSYFDIIKFVKGHGWAKYQPDDPFTLASGKKSPYYFDMRSALLDGRFLRIVEDEIKWRIVKLHAQFDLVGGMDTAARPLVSFVACLFHKPGFVLRKERKGYGLKNKIDGQAPIEGDRVLVVEDVITTGGSAKKVADYATSRDAEVVGLFSILNRGGLLDWVPASNHLFTPGDFFEELA
jgi:orotate phosphoribosyltransferase